MPKFDVEELSCYTPDSLCGVEQWQLVGLITRRSQVRILPPLLRGITAPTATRRLLPPTTPTDISHLLRLVYGISIYPLVFQMRAAIFMSYHPSPRYPAYFHRHHLWRFLPPTFQVQIQQATEFRRYIQHRSSLLPLNQHPLN